LFVVAAIAVFGGMLQMYLGEPQVSPRLDNVHRFMAGVYLSTGFISFWAATTIRQQGTLVYLLDRCCIPSSDPRALPARSQALRITGRDRTRQELRTEVLRKARRGSEENTTPSASTSIHTILKFP